MKRDKLSASDWLLAEPAFAVLDPDGHRATLRQFAHDDHRDVYRRVQVATALLDRDITDGVEALVVIFDSAGTDDSHRKRIAQLLSARGAVGRDALAHLGNHSTAGLGMIIVAETAATAGQHRFRTPRWASRLLGPYRRTTDDSEPEVLTSGVSWSVRQQVLREYHAATLAQARRASEQWVRAGFNAGAVPYGYRAQRVQIALAGRPARWRTRLVIEPVEAATVKMIFVWRGEDGLAIAAIRQRLLATRYPAPLGPETGQPGVWTHALIAATLRNPKYLGRQVWGRRHHGRRAPREVWVWSPEWAHPPIVSTDEFVAANRGTRLATALLDADRAESGWADRRAA